ncbi:MAG: hypothetical protein AAB645_02220 [Patescibacteria group bacterium]
MSRKLLLIAATLTLALLAVIDKLAFINFWYWRHKWFDFPMHFLGGISTGLFCLFVYALFQEMKGNGSLGFRPLTLVNLTLLVTVAIGISWEVFEYLSGRMIRFSWWESTGDVVIGLGGAELIVLSFIILFKWLPRK